MTTPPIIELTTRARDVFRLVVDAYLETGQPVGSRTLSKLATLNLSPASIRNVMQDLEELGLLASPHTSAGRLPTEQGLRLFVDGMMQVAEPSAEDRAQIEASLAEGGPIESALAHATAALSGLSACAGLVLVPKHERVLKQVAFVPMSDEQALVVLVAADGTVENRVIAIPPGLQPSTLVEAGNYVSAMLAGLTLAEAQARVRRELEAERIAIDRAAADLVSRGLAIWSVDGTDRPVLIVRGQANLLDESAVGDLDRVRLLLDELETKQDIAHLLDSAREGSATRIFIGSENKLFSLSGSSVIAAPYHGSDGRVVGVVGVIGPTRLNYARIVPMVDFTAQSLSRLIR
ncbi:MULTISPECIES: heat-inducible transcriptional repressor HrcA [Sphingopyxis]|uniref:heat-inducible transcriptional repressor HrcA n=1 Tax=Sphingopyxis TaxID=165697 RepID=UPI00086ECF17|nr:MULTISPECIES: heat-inducible transcriptional repressor HrcA [Sphingopyxis]APW72416.1 heat-inducible transcriptional repressor HrcA [Sphingopyxis granuli]AVA13256.1 heat-inducible transcriptional repressor HrcA [Sphingopyxis sp. MG]ODU30246.1 MAG: heat-inducible transcriptional repressor HrcA [Sphingopyxis sp. SCN 67-31]QUM71737.1 heat-inducible transcriptional repressor HrcA [Sphingopyxis granuli]